MDPRRSIMHAAVAAGGVSAILMSTAVNDSGAHARKAADECLDPLLRATVHAIDAAEGLPGSRQRAELRDVITDFLGALRRPEIELEAAAS
jgi:hypothetical protein